MLSSMNCESYYLGNIDSVGVKIEGKDGGPVSEKELLAALKNPFPKNRPKYVKITVRDSESSISDLEIRGFQSSQLHSFDDNQGNMCLRIVDENNGLFALWRRVTPPYTVRAQYKEKQLVAETGGVLEDHLHLPPIAKWYKFQVPI
jgi:hypothetical protein